MRRLLIVAVAVLVCGCGAHHPAGQIHAFNRWPQSRTVFETAGAATKVEAFRIDPNQGAAPANSATAKTNGAAPAPAARIGGFGVTAGPVELSKDQVERLRGVLGDRKTYDFDLHKRCKFQPGVALRFHAGAKSADLLVCFSCDELGVIEDRGTISTASITERKKLVELAQELFPKDREITALTR